MSNAHKVGDMVTVGKVSYRVVSVDSVPPMTKARNPSLAAWIGLRRPNGRRVMAAWQMMDGSIVPVVTL